MTLTIFSPFMGFMATMTTKRKPTTAPNLGEIPKRVFMMLPMIAYWITWKTVFTTKTQIAVTQAPTSPK